MIGGADVRITVQMNLFTGIIMNLGNKKQQEWMRFFFFLLLLFKSIIRNYYESW